MKQLFGYLLAVVVVSGAILIYYAGLGICPFGPTKVETVNVQRLYVSTEDKKSHYMVGTDKGVFEVDNSLFLWIWNADEIYSGMKQGETYKITTRGNKVTFLFIQEYPYIIKVEH